MKIPDHIFRELKNTYIFYADTDPGSGIFLTLDSASGMEEVGSGINIPDPQHCQQV
jgi:hypothetical protein